MKKAARHRRSRTERPPGPWVALLPLPFVALMVPSDLVLGGPLKSNGWPARILIFWIAAAIILGWFAHREPRRASPAEVGSWVLIFGLICSVAAAGFRQLTGVEAAGVTRVALVMIPLALISLGIASTANRVLTDLLLIGLLFGAAASSMIALAQFVVPFEWADIIRLPGLQTDILGNPDERGGFFRVKGASAHPIEFGVIVSSLIPVGLHFSRYAAQPLARQISGIITAIMVIAIPMSVSRSGIVTLALALGIYAVVMTPRQRLTTLVVGIAGLILFRATIPGLLGTVLSIFGSASEDNSVSGRTNDYTLVNDLFEHSPILGRGLGTFQPDEYFYLDNQYLLTLIEGGILLLGCTVLFLILGLASARGASLRAAQPLAASRAQAVAAGIVAISVSGLFFDLFSFGQATVVLFLLIGLAGALWHDGVDNGRGIGAPLERMGLRMHQANGIDSVRPQSARARGPLHRASLSTFTDRAHPRRPG